MRQNNREATAMIQTYLRQLSYHDNDIPAVVIDGIFDTKTRDSLRAFQRKYSLTPTGKSDLATFELLYQKYLESVEKYSNPNLLSIFPLRPDNFYFGAGDKGYAVGIIQYILRELGIIYEFPSIEINENFDNQTQSAVAIFQEKNGIYPTGRVDKATWNALSGQLNNLHFDYFNN